MPKPVRAWGARRASLAWHREGGFIHKQRCTALFHWVRWRNRTRLRFLNPIARLDSLNVLTSGNTNGMGNSLPKGRTVEYDNASFAPDPQARSRSAG